MTTVPLPPFAALRAFAAVGTLGGFRRAAVFLGVDHAIVSRHIRGLEQQLGTTLFDRKTGKMTEAGERYHLRVAAAIAELHAATEKLRPSARQDLTIWCSPGFALHWLAQNVGQFSADASNPSVSIHSRPRAARLDRGEADGDIRYEPDWLAGTEYPDLHIVKLARPEVFPVASPTWLDALPHPIGSASDLLTLPLIEEADGAEWMAWFASQGITRAVAESVSADVIRHGEAHLTLAAARAGQGIALSNKFLATDDISSNRLRKVRASEPLTAVTLGAYIFRYTKSQRKGPAMRRLAQWLLDRLAES